MKIISNADAIRLDKYISEVITDISRNKIKHIIQKGLVRVEGKVVNKAKYIIRKGQIIEIEDDALKVQEIKPQEKKLDIIYENDDFAVINKPKDVIVHPTDHIRKDTLVNYLISHYERLSDVGGETRKGIVHRLDKDTTGLIIICKNNQTHDLFKQMFKNREIEKYYLALVHGNFIEKHLVIKTFISRSERNRKKMEVTSNGRYAESIVDVLEQTEDFSLVKVQIKTGRTHQIRVHMNYINHPVVGDRLYCNRKEKFNTKGQLLNCHQLKFKFKGKEYNFKSTLDEEFLRILNILKFNYENLQFK